MPPILKTSLLPYTLIPFTTPVATKIYLLYDLNMDYFKHRPSDCTCASSPSIYNLDGHFITGGFSIINNTSL